MKFVLPQSPEAQIQMHSEWLTRVRAAIQDGATYKDRFLPELQRHETLLESMRASDPGSPETRKQIAEVAKMRLTLKDQRKQELCLRDQARRLEERILSLQIGCST